MFSILGIGFDPAKDIVPGHVVMAFIVTAIIIVFFKLSVKNLSIFPGKMQNVLEMFYKFFQGLVDDMMGHEGRKFIPVLGTLGTFIAVSNVIGLMPEMGSPTANLNVTAGCAIFIFIYYHYYGVKKHGAWGYVKTFMGPAWWLAWLFIPIEIVSHFSRILSLSMRLFGNIFGEDMVIIIIGTYLLSFVAPVPVMALALFTSLLQAFIFVMLSTIYLAGAMAEEH
ncbi:MAG: F0F1 ATP synthase subunit A [bacterium]|nr:F0F1 ATP synthase subunit A [bacterium]